MDDRIFMANIMGYDRAITAIEDPNTGLKHFEVSARNGDKMVDVLIPENAVNSQLRHEDVPEEELTCGIRDQETGEVKTYPVTKILDDKSLASIARENEKSMRGLTQEGEKIDLEGKEVSAVIAHERQKKKDQAIRAIEEENAMKLEEAALAYGERLK